MRFLPDRFWPEPRFLLWLALAILISFVFSLSVAVGVGFSATAIENGPQENVEIAQLLVTAGLFATTAIAGRGPGAPAMMGLSLIFGVMGLREFETPMDNDVLAYLAGHDVRTHWAILAVAVAAALAVRDRQWTWWQHAKASAPVWLPVIAAALVVLIGLQAEELADVTPDGRWHDMLEWLEETLEVCAYGVAVATGAWMLSLRQRPDEADPS
ncbi:hypothetical protein [Brevundimonas sp.]|uniref:hypothetical protein n=1 Tax=Brevundimonas sp. TaxID=1871086 RepID=UPI002ABB5DA3|nr:hypothetical protein [Brevundimonas sp.]MDZ4362549.1 hypothetical protein [Brevundimonas sp.]